MTPKEIATALRVATKYDDLAPLHTYIRDKRETGAPVALEEALCATMVEAIQIRGRLLDRLAEESDRAKRGIASLTAGTRVMAYEFAVQTNHTVVVHAAELTVASDNARRLIDVFEAIADRIVATPEEREASATAQTRRLAVAWMQCSMRRMREACKYAGLPVDGDRPTLVHRLAAAGMAPEAA